MQKIQLTQSISFNEGDVTNQLISDRNSELTKIKQEIFEISELQKQIVDLTASQIEPLNTIESEIYRVDSILDHTVVELQNAILSKSKTYTKKGCLYGTGVGALVGTYSYICSEFELLMFIPSYIQFYLTGSLVGTFTISPGPGTLVGTAVGAPTGLALGYGVGKSMEKIMVSQINDDIIKHALEQNNTPWIYRDECSNCKKCNKPFNFQRWSYNCRICGGLFCHNCANNTIKIKLPNVDRITSWLSNTKITVRACDGCCHEL